VHTPHAVVWCGLVAVLDLICEEPLHFLSLLI